MKWYRELPKGAKVLLLLFVAVAGGAFLFNSGYVVGGAIGKATQEEETQ